MRFAKLAGMGWRIHFTADDLARTRIGTTLGPLAETLFGLSLVRSKTNSPNGFAGWRESVRGRLTSEMKPLAALSPRGWFGVDLWTLTGEAPTIERGLQALVTMPPAHVEAELVFYASDCRLPKSVWDLAATGDHGRRALALAAHATYRALIEPYWPRVSSHLHAERVSRSRTVLEGGVERLFATLNPLIKWRSPILHVAVPGQDFDMHLDGRGLVLVPSLFVGDRPLLLWDLIDPTAAPRLVFSASRDPQLWNGASPKGTLAALLGRTRAAALMRIADGCSTSELANHLGVSVAAASQHATVSRDNGLITTRRDGGAVLHTVTTLGAELLRVSL